jgi:hypothetical protein
MALSVFCAGAIAFVHVCPNRPFGLTDDSCGLILDRLGHVTLVAAVVDCALSVAVMSFTDRPHSVWLWVGVPMPLAVVCFYPVVVAA